ncbi:MAG TPA: bifunctional riboflavin kinase/FAD synthetase [candidate division WOR-3 bacterium]|uniref:Riboflavin biosynthesis protein n=1 Tax=candidate division WOR-3 bacterium TaxID=2052148 RepID=A0A7C0VA81_UNCW3|nr:bifunctional riboflavin kinase/FAD synthetase [candidate division WOR-3 bacterium]
MKVYNWDELPEVWGVIALGSFDGVHIGHQKLLSFAKARGSLTVVTFTPHPRLFLGLERENFLLTLDEEKEELLLRYGAQRVIFIDFNKEFSGFTPSEFVKEVITNRLKPHRIVVGFDYHFGKNSTGHASDLKALCKNYGIDVHIFPEVIRNRKPVKSTLIRNLLKEGKVEKAMEYLGRPYRFSGDVVKGKGLGSKIGFPTVNLKVNPLKVLPGNGVYGVQVMVRGGIYPGMLYIGDRPTIGEKDTSIEAHIIGFDGMIYGEKLCVEVFHKIREQVKFESMNELRKRLGVDRETVLKKMKEVKDGA